MEPTRPSVGSIVVAHSRYNCASHFFAKIEADFPHEVILRPIREVIVSGDMTTGREVPSESARVTWTKRQDCWGLSLVWAVSGQIGSRSQSRMERLSTLTLINLPAYQNGSWTTGFTDAMPAFRH